ncbi:hypothetical protein TVNIR_1104 [Thioalkalivibrio nitratireducens DSM 14787]|uniref:Uncharacterized protein n=1 Tax=Thioalkalivibrio nitratireducens (strain DSM 14787 / UNIQEM 213 / ALEN2) TaxID=1255043 RepID=L0DUT7_THIND|nr:hypothetical protein TVNIR_1104 [Thioalkalivibrio nitratireducens DSM 14787]
MRLAANREPWGRTGRQQQHRNCKSSHFCSAPSDGVRIGAGLCYTRRATGIRFQRARAWQAATYGRMTAELHSRHVRPAESFAPVAGTAPEHGCQEAGGSGQDPVPRQSHRGTRHPGQYPTDVRHRNLPSRRS